MSTVLKSFEALEARRTSAGLAIRPISPIRPIRQIAPPAPRRSQWVCARCGGSGEIELTGRGRRQVNVGRVVNVKCEACNVTGR